MIHLFSKRSVFSCLFVLIALTMGATAHQGKIGLYTDTSASDVDATFMPFVSYNITIMYYRSDAGPDGITAAEFKVEVPAGLVVIASFTPSPDVSTTQGDIAVGISCSYAGCTGSGNDYTLIGTVTVLPLVATLIQIRILGSENLPDGVAVEPKVTMCDDPERTIVDVLGGLFCSPNGACWRGTESESWGAIKQLYK